MRAEQMETLRAMERIYSECVAECPEGSCVRAEYTLKRDALRAALSELSAQQQPELPCRQSVCPNAQCSTACKWFPGLVIDGKLVRWDDATAPQPDKAREPTERIDEAAIRKTAFGSSHAECFGHLASKNPGLQCNVEQGFLTSTGRFVDRVEALRIAVAAGQLVGRTKHRPYDKLMSEDLWDGDREPEQPAEGVTERRFCSKCGSQTYERFYPKAEIAQPVEKGEGQAVTFRSLLSGGAE